LNEIEVSLLIYTSLQASPIFGRLTKTTLMMVCAEGTKWNSLQELGAEEKKRKDKVSQLLLLGKL